MPTNVAQLLLLRFRLAQSGEFRFFHSPTVYAFLHARLGTQLSDPFPSGVRLLAVESNRTRYAAGDAYHIALAVLPHSELCADALVAKLRPRSRDARLNKTPLGPRTSLIEAIDLVTGKALRASGTQAAWLSFEALGQQARRLAEAREVTLRFDSPLLILRRPVQRRDTFLDEESFDAKVLLARGARAVSEQYPELVPLDVPEVELLGNRLCRAETYYRGLGNRHQGLGNRQSTNGKILPGAIGEVTLGFHHPIGFDWALRLLLAGLVGVGKSTAMGQGRFHLVGMPVHERWPPAPAKTLCERMASDERLAGAREALRDAGPSAGVDDVGRDEFLESLSYRWGVLQDALRTGEHRPSPLRGLLIERTDGKLRPLAVPTLDDRFLQRACCDEIAPAIDERLEETSFAYRRGLSGRNAEYHVRQAHDAGYRHVLDADLRSFFDSVDWGLLEARLRAYFGSAPKAVQLLMRWVQAPVQFGERLVRRSQGLPQGAVISPLLANLYLDSFDEAIQAQGFRLVRYADDFVVLCKSATEVSRARDVVARELARLKLELHTGKTSATSFEHGFEFLGYIFARSLALPKKPVRAECQVHHGPDEIAGLRQLKTEDAQGWLADWLDFRLRW
jgi:group II intron reverse transcriptase/maturase